MTSELISSKEHGKERIRNAILGILLALGAYTILYTINPKLLDVCLKLDTVTITIDSESESAPWTGVAQLTGPTTNCIEGYTDVSTQGGQPSTINVCKSLSSNLTRMISAAKSNSLILSGWGSRTYAQQVTLRQQHGCPDIYNSPSTACTPQTARPGHSKHESGKAVDFTCNGAEMAGSSCFNWLKTNAGTYGFKNLASEPWHWSDDGR